MDEGRPPPLASARTYRLQTPPSPLIDDAHLGVSLLCSHRFLTHRPEGSFANPLGEHLGRLARGALDLPFAVLYRVEQLCTSGALCPSLTKCGGSLPPLPLLAPRQAFRCFIPPCLRPAGGGPKTDGSVGTWALC